MKSIGEICHLNPIKVGLNRQFQVKMLKHKNRTMYQNYSFYRASICEGGLGSRNSVRLSVRLSHARIVTNLNGTLRIF